jgi:hypothetical protein
LGSPRKGGGTFVQGFLVGVDDEMNSEFGRVTVAKLYHFLELIARIDVQKRKRDLAGKKSLLGQPEQDGRIFTNGIQQDGALALGDYFAQDVNAFRLKLFEVAERGH